MKRYIKSVSDEDDQILSRNKSKSTKNLKNAAQKVVKKKKTPIKKTESEKKQHLAKLKVKEDFDKKNLAYYDISDEENN